MGFFSPQTAGGRNFTWGFARAAGILARLELDEPSKQASTLGSETAREPAGDQSPVVLVIPFQIFRQIRA
jgi:hypothetical protein